mmetsp:Transcript_6545/g.17546  ORF Transcript_6545/g.17546 Transcript_6545/m.17546 type:complete len:279 (+) Transcript_6545:26-862(+)
MEVELAVRCTRLPKMDMTSESDPVAVLMHGAEEVARSETVENASDVEFARRFRVGAEHVGSLYRIDVFDKDDAFGKTRLQYIGSANVKASKIFEKETKCVRYPLEAVAGLGGDTGAAKGALGDIEVFAHCVYPQDSKSYTFELVVDPYGTKLLKSSLFYEVLTMIGGEPLPCFRSEIQHAGSNSKFEPAIIQLPACSTSPADPACEPSRVALKIYRGPIGKKELMGGLFCEAVDLMRVCKDTTLFSRLNPEFLEGEMKLMNAEIRGENHFALEIQIST